jgi:hypothetical protein
VVGRDAELHALGVAQRSAADDVLTEGRGRARHLPAAHLGPADWTRYQQEGWMTQEAVRR